eukprot:TRINITY_DN7485_c0_g2_i1.p1 TRINITY_DN7485_c0_g2~~TRINITY_DN7485_c0_g2_i1.p1  ORF type:complete len:297 (+),score=82.80 TRINITY_DN7485_c0_g2_i1:77-967(+)
MFDIINQNFAYEEEWGDDFSTSSEEIWNFDDDNLDGQLVEVSNPLFLESILSNDGAPLDALIDFHSELLLNPIDTPIKFQEEKKVISTPLPEIETSIEIEEISENKKANDSKTMKKLFENDQERKTTGGKSLQQYPGKSPVSMKSPAEKTPRKAIGGKSLKQLQQTYNAKNNQKTPRKNSVPNKPKISKKSASNNKKQVSIFSEESIEIIDDLPSPNSKKRKSAPNKSLKKKTKSLNAIDVDTPSEMIYDILTNDLDTPHMKATTLERKLSKVFMGEEILKIMKDDGDEDEDIDSI